MNKLLLLLTLLAVFKPLHGFAMPCETYEPNCDESQPREDNDDSDNDQDDRPADPNGPDYEGDEDEI